MGTADLSLILGVTGLFLLAIVVRILPRQLSPLGLGVDHYYWIQHVREIRRARRFPPVLSQYVLEESQWYPPVFPLMLALLPEDFLEKAGHYLAVALDLARMSVVIACAYAWSAGSPQAVLIAGLLYALTPVLVSFNVQLNPRGLAALLLDLAVLLGLNLLNSGWSLLTATTLFVITGLILLTHKMTTQLFWFLCIAGAVALGDVRPLLLIPLSMLSAVILSGGRYRFLLRAHGDIVSFWSRNWKWMQAHAIKESPLYGDPGYESPNKLHQRGLVGFIRHVRYLVAYTPHTWLLAVLLLLPSRSQETIPNLAEAIAWSGGILAFVLATVFVPRLKCLGNGYLYLYNIAFPAAVLGGLVMGNELSDALPFAPHVITMAVIIQIVALGFFYRGLLVNKTQRIDPAFERLVDQLAQKARGTVMCLPGNWYEFVSHRTGFPVLWGGHGYGFRMLEPTFPRLLVPIHDVIHTYGVSYLICIAGDLPERFLADLPRHAEEEYGPYRLMTF